MGPTLVLNTFVCVFDAGCLIFLYPDPIFSLKASRIYHTFCPDLFGLQEDEDNQTGNGWDWQQQTSQLKEQRKDAKQLAEGGLETQKVIFCPSDIKRFPIIMRSVGNLFNKGTNVLSISPLQVSHFFHI